VRTKVTARLSSSDAKASAAALQVIRDALVANGFRLTGASSTEVTALGPGMWSMRQNPIRGVSKAVARARGSTIEIDAELAGAERLGLFVMLLPLALTLGLAVVLVGAQRGTFAANPDSVVYLFLLPVVWMILGPVLRWRVRRRTSNALEALVASAATVSRGS
jgi:hypothetical protein